MRIRYLPALTLLLCSGVAVADRQPGWDFGGDLIYAFSQDIDFEGGSNASLDDDLGVALSFNYRFTPRLELMLGLDWNQVDYDVTVAPGDAAAGLGFSATGELEYWTPRVGLNFNFLETDLTPYHHCRHRLELHRHQHPGFTAADGVLVGPVVGLLLRHLSEHAELR